jgi:hypothetical protein
MTDNQDYLDVSVAARWTAKLPVDIDPKNDLRSDAEMKERIAEEIGVKRREGVVQWEIDVESEVMGDG